MHHQGSVARRENQSASFIIPMMTSFEASCGTVLDLYGSLEFHVGIAQSKLPVVIEVKYASLIINHVQLYCDLSMRVATK